jgi:hypothetical protein
VLLFFSQILFLQKIPEKSFLSYTFLLNLDRSFGIQNDMQSTTDERRARQMLEEQVRVITSVCKKLNQDIEVGIASSKGAIKISLMISYF